MESALAVCDNVFLYLNQSLAKTKDKGCVLPPPLWVGYRLALTAKTVTCLSSPKTPDRKVKLSNDDDTRYIHTKVETA